jgi:predicted acylesterase/phospholipase RssA
LNRLTRNACSTLKATKRRSGIPWITGVYATPAGQSYCPHLNNEIDTAINKLLQVVRNQHPYALVLKGGGVRGLAFAGALLELEKYYSFDTFAGTSAGAIAAVLLACQYRPGELMQILKEKNFKDFKDAAFPQNMFNFIFKGGFYPGNVLEKWIASLVADRTNKLNAARMKDLPYHAVVYAAMLKEGAITFDSRSHRSDTSVAFAARCSMSIPFYFIPRTIENLNVFDGGIRHNFPAQIFSTAYPDKPFIALYLDESRGQGKKTFWQKCRSVFGEHLEGSFPSSVSQPPWPGNCSTSLPRERSGIL